MCSKAFRRLETPTKEHCKGPSQEAKARQSSKDPVEKLSGASHRPQGTRTCHSNLTPEGLKRLDTSEGIEGLFGKFYSPICGFFRKLGWREEAEDLTQETFLRVQKSLDTLRSESHFEQWLYQIAYNVHRQLIREKTAAKRAGIVVSFDALSIVDREQMDRLDLATPPKALDHVLDRETSRLLRELLADLPEQMRQCLEMRLLQDLRYREIAEALEISLDTVKVQLHRGRSRLAQRLGSVTKST